MSSSLYFHIPYCLSKCPYCDFYSRPLTGGALEGYVEALCADLRHSRSWYDGGSFDTVFFGGGTPSLLGADQVERLLSAANESYGIHSAAEITLEANPGTLCLSLLAGYRSAGVTRLSLGVQSFDDEQLRWLGRRHSAAQAVSAVELARRAGFENLSLDLMFALPGQTPHSLLDQCRWLQRLAPQHLSAYGLTVEEGTPLAARHAEGGWCEADDETYRQSFMLLDEQLATLGYQHYEISNYAQPNQRCRHNLAYWQRQPCLGIGAGAHSFLNSGWGERWACDNCDDDYRRVLAAGGSPRHCLETFSRSQAMAEYVYLALRCRAGVDGAAFQSCFGQSFAEVFASAIHRCSAHLHKSDERWWFDVDGWLLYDHFIENFL